MKNLCLKVFVCFVVAFFGCYSWASEKSINVDGLKKEEVVDSIGKQLEQAGLNFGIAAFYMDGDRPVEQIYQLEDDRVLSAETASRARIGGVLEAHFLRGELGNKTQAYIEGKIAKGNDFSYVESDFSWGVSAVVELGGSDTIRSFGLGPVISLKKYEISYDSSSKEVKIDPKGKAFNLGLVYVLEPNVGTLSDGLEIGQVVPDSITPRVVEEERTGLAVVFSTNF